MGFDLSAEIVDFVGGSVAGAVSVVVGQPFDTVKVKNKKHHIIFFSVAILFYYY